MKFDLHIHTTWHSPDSQIDPFVMVRQALKIGLDGLVITEHDWLWTEEELEEVRSAAPGLVVLAGIEVTAREGHFLVYGAHNPFAFPRGIGVVDLCREAHRQEGAVVAAHPFRWGQPFDEILRDEQPELDGLEVMTSNMDELCRQRAAGIVRHPPSIVPKLQFGNEGRRHHLAGLGSSDAHQEEVLGVCYTVFEATIRNGRDLVHAIRSGRLVARERTTPVEAADR